MQVRLEGKSLDCLKIKTFRALKKWSMVFLDMIIPIKKNKTP